MYGVCVWRGGAGAVVVRMWRNMQGSFINQAWELDVSIHCVTIADCKSGRVAKIILLSALENSRCPSDPPSGQRCLFLQLLELLVGDSFQLILSLEFALRGRDPTPLVLV